MSNFVVAAIAAVSLIPQRLVGNVTESKDGTVTIDFKEPGMVKTTTRSFAATDLVAYMAGETGFVIAMVNDPVAKFTGEHSVKNGATTIKTENGVVHVNSNPGAYMTLTVVDEDSKEAKAAARAGKIKVRGAGRKAKAEKPERGSKKKAKLSKAERLEKRGKKKSKKSADDAPAPKKRKKRAA